VSTAATRVWAVLLTAALLCVGCTHPAKGLVTNSTDRARAQRIQQDPWLTRTPLRVRTAAGYAPGSNRQLSRRVTGRQESTRLDPRAAVLAEVHLALADGWRLVYARCLQTPSAPPTEKAGELAPRGQVAAVLQLGAGDLSRQAAAVVDATALSPAGAGSQPPIATVEVDGYVPHHADVSWPSSRAVDVATTCLTTSGYGSSGALPALPFTPIT